MFDCAGACGDAGVLVLPGLGLGKYPGCLCVKIALVIDLLIFLVRVHSFMYALSLGEVKTSSIFIAKQPNRTASPGVGECLPILSKYSITSSNVKMSMSSIIVPDKALNDILVNVRHG